MDKPVETIERKHTPIPAPDIQDKQALDKWCSTYITEPMAGFIDLKNPDGTPASRENQLAATKKLILDTIPYRKDTLKQSDEEIGKYLAEMVAPIEEELL